MNRYMMMLLCLGMVVGGLTGGIIGFLIVSDSKLSRAISASESVVTTTNRAVDTGERMEKRMLSLSVGLDSKMEKIDSNLDKKIKRLESRLDRFTKEMNEFIRHAEPNVVK